MRVKDVAEILRTKGGYLHFELNGDYYAIQSLSGLHHDRNKVILTLCKTNGFNDIGTLWDYFALELFDFHKYSVLLNINNRLYDFPNEITVRDDNLHDLEYIAKLDTTSTQETVAYVSSNTVKTPETVNYTTLNMLYERSSRYHDCDFNNAKIVTQANGVVVELKHENVHFTVNTSKDGNDNCCIVLDI